MVNFSQQTEMINVGQQNNVQIQTYSLKTFSTSNQLKLFTKLKFINISDAELETGIGWPKKWVKFGFTLEPFLRSKNKPIM